jgi:hypothetical protein
VLFEQVPHWCGMMSGSAGLERHRRRPRRRRYQRRTAKNGEELSPPHGLVLRPRAHIITLKSAVLCITANFGSEQAGVG